METVLEYLRANTDVFGFSVAALIFLITIGLVSRKLIGFSITLLLLLFALFAGLMIANQGFIKDHFRNRPKENTSELSQNLKMLRDELKQEKAELQLFIEDVKEETKSNVEPKIVS